MEFSMPSAHEVLFPEENPDGLPVWFNPNAPLEDLDRHLKVLREYKNNKINQWRLEANRGVFIHKGKKFACDLLSRSDIDGANSEIINRGHMPTVWPGTWKAIDNTTISITTVEEWKDFYTSMYNQGTTNFMRSQYLKYFLTVFNMEQLMALTWETRTPIDPV